MSRLRIALFVEGSQAPSSNRRSDPLLQLWNEDIAVALDIRPFDRVVPISKKHLIAMDPSKPKMSGASEGLDRLIVRQMNKEQFDAAVIAWDLVPAWNPEESFCRWIETKTLYRLLSCSTALPEQWRSKAQQRYDELATRAAANARPGIPKIKKYSIVAVCMDPMFEGLLTQDERAAKRALGVINQHIPNWPAQGWGDVHVRRPDDAILSPALTAIRKLNPTPRIIKQIRGDLITNKTAWGEYLLRAYLRDPQARNSVLRHSICARLKELLG